VNGVTGFLASDDAADFIEYAFIIGMISVATASLITPMMPTIVAVLDKIAAAVSSVKP
jgi:Flp pilus assembly pilin Flp